MPTSCRRRSREVEAGFTLVEMMIALFIGAFVFTALAAYLAGGVKVLSNQKTRTQANEIATQAIEDLQRLDDEYIGFCAGPPSPPSGFTDAVVLPHCPGNTVAHDPCQPPVAPTAPAHLAPKHSYDCQRVNITFAVKRFVAWADSRKVDKKLLVRVNWTDNGVAREVVQETKRATAAPPTVVSGKVDGVNPRTFNIEADGTLQAPLSLTATTTGLMIGDTVRANFLYRGPTDMPQPAAVNLTTADGIDWSATINPGDFKFALGTQFMSFTAVRGRDNKEGSGGVVDLTAQCGVASCPTSATALGVTAPTISYTPVLGSSITPDADSAGALVSNEIVISTTTTNGNPGSVIALVPTHGAGVRPVPMKIGSCTGSTCNWSVTVSKAMAGARGFRFTNTDSPALRVVAAQGISLGTTATASSPVSFQ